MSLLSQVQIGKVKKPHFVTIFGPPGVGKTSFGSEAPQTIFACTEDGTNNFDIARFPKIESFEQMMEAIKELKTTKHAFKTFVIDSLDHFEPLVWAKACKDNGWKNIEDGVFGKGFSFATQLWNQFFQELKDLREKMNIVMICHSQVKPFNDPSQAVAYDRYELKLHKGANALVKENCEAVLFASYNTVINVDKNTKKAKGFGGDSRVLFTEYRAHHDGKNRLGLPYKIELSWKSFHEAAEQGNPESNDVISSTIEGLLTKIADPTIKEKATEQFNLAKAANDTKKLIAIKNRVLQVTQE